ncbi:C2 domain-containing protein [Lipomyces arxii]|uniref:C2 domain-containing protein n=1 Tax=Lipomyces arxii TaxID=56418 RepID=UPI0034CDBB69
MASIHSGKKSRFSTPMKFVSGTVNAAAGAVTGTVGMVGDVAGKAVDVATLGQLKTERTPPPEDPLWDMHRAAQPADEKVEAEKKLAKRRKIGGWIEDIEEYETDFRDRVTFLEYYLKDKFYGDWYHNAAVIFFTAISSWIVARFSGSILWLVIILACTSTYYRTSILRVRRRVRDDLARESALVKLETDAESMEWLNSFLVKFWAIFLPTLNGMVIEIANQTLSGIKAPSPIDSLALKRFTLGTKPPRIDLVRTYPKTEEDVVVMDWGFSFIPNDITDLTSRQLKDKINPLVELQVRVGKGVVSVGMPILVQDMALKALVQVKLKLITSFPHVQTASVSLLKPPYFDFVLKPIGGETFGVDMNFLPGLESFIKSTVDEQLGPMLYDPNSITINLEQIMSGVPNDAAIGVLAVTLYQGRGFKGGDSMGNTMDPYVKLSLNGGEELARTSIKRDTATPKWNETKILLISSLTDALTMEALDFNDIRKDKLVGTVTFPLAALEGNPEQENVAGKLIHNGKERGELIFDARFFPTLAGRTLDDGTVEPPPQLNTGILRFTFHQAKDLDLAAKKGFGSSGLNPYAVYNVDGKDVHTTKVMKNTNSPVWDEAHEILLTSKRSSVLSFSVRDDRDLSGSSTIASYKVKVDDLLASLEKGSDWVKLVPAGRARITAQFKPVAVKGIAGSGGYVPPIGILRFHCKSASDLRNLETVGKVDPYVRAMVNNYQKARTVTINNNLNPAWDEIIYATITSPNEKIALDVMDSEHDGKDRSLGELLINAGEIIKKNAAGEYVEFIDSVERTGQLIMPGRTPKGQLHYKVSFFPVLNCMDPEEIAEEEKAAAEAAAAAAAEPPSKNGGKKTVNGDKGGPLVNGDKPNPVEAAIPVDENGNQIEVPKPEPVKLKLGPEELVKYESGLLIFKVLEGSFSKSGVYVQIYFDDFLFPSYVSGRANGRKARFEEVGDGLIRELDWSKMHIRLTSKANSVRSDDDNVIASMTGSTLAHLKQGYNKPATLQFQTKEPGAINTLKMSFKYIPVLMELDPIESRLNQGFVRVSVLDANDLPAADRRGKSDPYAQFILNGEKVFKSKVVKKTLSPDWNEVFECAVPSLINADFVIKVYDWDMGPGDDDFLGAGKINLAGLEPMQNTPCIINLDGKSGQVRLQLQFRPDYVLRSIRGVSTFSGTLAVPGRVMTSVAGAPVKGVSAAAGGVKKGASFFRHGFKSSKDKTEDDSASVSTHSSSRQ